MKRPFGLLLVFAVLLTTPFSRAQDAGVCMDSRVSVARCLEAADPVGTCRAELDKDPADFRVRVALCEGLVKAGEFDLARKVLKEGRVIATDSYTRHLIDVAVSNVDEASRAKVVREPETLRYLITKCRLGELDDCNAAITQAPGQPELVQTQRQHPG